MMKRTIVSIIIGLFLSGSAAAQWQTPDHSIPIGRGAGISGFKSLGPCAVGQVTIGNGASADPTCGIIPANNAIKLPVQLATTANITLSGEQTIDGVLTSTSRVLVKDQSTPSQNGCYVTAAGAWARCIDANTTGQLVNGTQVRVTSGNANGNFIFVVSTANPITIGSTSINFIYYLKSINVTQFVGTDRSGGTDSCSSSSLGLPAAMTALANLGTAGALYIPRGTYLCSKQLTASNQNIRIYGDGAGLSIIQFTNATASAAGISVAQNSFGFQTEIRGLSLGTSVDQVNGNAGLSITYPSSSSINKTITIDDVEIAGTSNNGHYWANGINLANGVLGVISNFNIRGKDEGNPATGMSASNMSAAIKLSGYSTGVNFGAGNANFANYGIEISGDSEGQVITGGQFIAVNYGVYLHDGTFGDSTSVGGAPGPLIGTGTNFATYKGCLVAQGWNQIIATGVVCYRRPETTQNWIGVQLLNGTYGSNTYGSNENKWSNGFFFMSSPLATAVAVAATTNIALTGTYTLDGYAIQVGDRILAGGQTAAAANGVYVAAAGAWARATDFPNAGSIALGIRLQVTNGSTYGTKYFQVTNSGAVVGTALTFGLSGYIKAFLTDTLSDGNDIDNNFASQMDYFIDTSNSTTHNILTSNRCSFFNSLAGGWTLNNTSSYTILYNNITANCGSATSTTALPTGATPAVGGFSQNEFYTNNGSPTTITNLLHGYATQTIIIYSGDAGKTTIQNNANILLQGGRDITLAGITDFVTLRFEGNLWRQVGGGGNGFPTSAAPSILDYGAKCDNSTNDAAAVQAALNANKIVSVPAASNYCLINTSVSIPTGRSIVSDATGIDFNGGANCFKATTLSGDMFTIAGGDVSLIGVCFEHNGPTGSIINDNGSKLGTNNFHDVSFSATHATNASPLVHFDSSANAIRGGAFGNHRPNSNAYSISIDATGGTTRIGNRVESVIFSGESPNAGPGIFVGSSDASARQEGFFMKGNMFVQQGPSNLRLDAVLSAHIEGNEFDQASSWNIVIAPSSSLGVSGVQFVNNLISTPTQQTNGVCVYQQTTTYGTSDITFIGNNFLFCGYGMFFGLNASNITVQGNNFNAIGNMALQFLGSSNIIIDGNRTSNVGGTHYNYVISDLAAGRPYTITNNQFDPAGLASLTINTASNFIWSGNSGGGGGYPAGLTNTTPNSGGALALTGGTMTGSLGFSSTNTLDIGTSATVLAPRTVYAGTSFVGPLVAATTAVTGPAHTATTAFLNTSAIPTLSTCGTGSPVASTGSSNQGGQFTIGGGTITTCTVTFAVAYPNFAFCTISPANAGASAVSVLPYISASSKTAFTVTMAASTPGAVFNYGCQGQ